ncbi:MAG: hypothetical protein E7406_04680 [Ruminococcaceae bacterium]|nr:hypothetical protein [Oscillospiraceae bacterium]
MDFLDKVKKIASDVASTSSKQSKKLYATAKLNLEISNKQKKVKELYKEIGFEAYKSFKEDGKVLEAIQSRLEKIDAYEEEIAELRKKIDSLKNTEEVGVEDIPAPDSQAVEADVYDGQSEYDEAETEPIDEE